MSAAARYFADPSVKIIPQMDFEIQPSQNGGAEATQSFLVRKSSLGTIDLSAFDNGTRYELVDPNVPDRYKNLTVKTAGAKDFAPGWCMVMATFTGVSFDGSGGAGSSGTPATIPTYSLAGNLEEAPMNEHPKWVALTWGQKYNLGLLMAGHDGITYDPVSDQYGRVLAENDDVFIALNGASFTPTGDEINFARMLSQGRTTYKKPTWTYSIRVEAEIGFTTAQLNSLGKIVATPPGNPNKPSSAYTWMNVAPNQEQSGFDRFFLDDAFLLVDDNADNQFLYGT